MLTNYPNRLWNPLCPDGFGRFEKYAAVSTVLIALVASAALIDQDGAEHVQGQPEYACYAGGGQDGEYGDVGFCSGGHKSSHRP